MGVRATRSNGLRQHWPFGAVLLAVAASRLWFALTYPVAQISDYGAYYSEARGIAGLIPLSASSLNAFGPKFFYAGWFWLFGDGLAGIGVINTILYLAALVLIYAGACRIFDRTTALVTSIIAFFSLSELYFINLTSTEVPGTLFMAAIVLILSRGSLTLRSALLLGVVGGLSVYNRSNMLPIGALVLAHEVLVGRGAWPALWKTALVQAVALVVTLPLCYFNLAQFGRFTPLIANSEQLWLGNNPKLSGDFHKVAPIPEDFPPGSPQRSSLAKEYASFYVSPTVDQDVSHLNTYDRSDIRLRYAVAWISHNHRRYLELVSARFQFLFFSCTYGEVPYRFYTTNPDQPRWEPGPQRLMERARLPIRRLYQYLIAGALIGLLICVARYGPVSFLRSTKGMPFVIIVFYSTPFILSVAANRYHIPILNLAWIYLAHGLVTAGRAVTRRPQGVTLQTA